MMGWRDEDDEADDLGERDDPAESDIDDTDEPELVQCPYCRKHISEEAERCHHCGNYIVTDDVSRRFPWFVLVGVILAGVVVLLWTLS